MKHRYTNFQSYLDFHKMQDVPGFCSAGHICWVQIYFICDARLSR